MVTRRSPKPGSAGASAPGKLMIAGEYAVLEGAPALVAAVGTRARAIWSAGADDGSPAVRSDSPEKGSIPPEAVLARQQAEAICAVTVPHELHIDVDDLRRDGRKLGLGSSSAAAAATAGAVFAWAGHTLGETAVRKAVLGAALAGHRAVAPEGSGADVAAGVLGGFVRVRRPESGGLEAENVPWPPGLHVRVVWTGAEARTSDLLAAVRALAEQNTGRYRETMDTLAEASGDFLDAMAAGEPRRVVEATRAHTAAMAALGEAAAAPVVEARLRQVAELAEAQGGAAKPSGAGGGDVAVAFFGDRDAARRFDRACADAELTMLCPELGAEGVLPLDVERDPKVQP